MKPKERVLAALDHRATDRTPTDITMDELVPPLEAALRRHFMVKDVEAVRMPLQFSAARMDPRRLKARYGSNLCFYGGVDIQHTLPYGTPEEVRAEVRDLIGALGKDGGYILAPSHSLLDDVPVANVPAMYGEAQHYHVDSNWGTV